MPQKAVLLTVQLTPPSDQGEREIDLTWSGTPEQPGMTQTYVGTLRCTGEIALRDDDGQAMYKWLLKTIPVDATFLAPTNDPADRAAERIASKMIQAVYVGHGHKTWDLR